MANHGFIDHPDYLQPEPTRENPPLRQTTPDSTILAGALRAKAEFVGIVEAPDEEAAISAAIDLFKITDPHQKRLLAQRRS